MRSNITLCLEDLPLDLPLGTPEDKGLYLTVYPTTFPNTDTVYCSRVQYSALHCSGISCSAMWCRKFRHTKFHIFYTIRIYANKFIPQKGGYFLALQNLQQSSRSNKIQQNIFKIIKIPLNTQKKTYMKTTFALHF